MNIKKNVIHFVVLSLFSTAVLAASVPHTFVAGEVASATQVNANFTALVNAVTTLETKVAALEAVNAPLTAADVAGTYQILSIASATGSLAATKRIASESGAMDGTLTFNAGGTFSGVSNTRSNRFSAMAQNCVPGPTLTQAATAAGESHVHALSATSNCSQSDYLTSGVENILNESISGSWALNAGTSTITVSPAGSPAFTVYISKRGGVGFFTEVQDMENPDAVGRSFALRVLVKQ